MITQSKIEKLFGRNSYKKNYIFLTLDIKKKLKKKFISFSCIETKQVNPKQISFQQAISHGMA